MERRWMRNGGGNLYWRGFFWGGRCGSFVRFLELFRRILLFFSFRFRIGENVFLAI